VIMGARVYDPMLAFMGVWDDMTASHMEGLRAEAFLV
jgi:hypothetical protein